MSDVIWTRSTACEANQCVEVALSADAVLVRESRNGRYGAVLRFTHDEWRAFTAGLQNGEFAVGDA